MNNRVCTTILLLLVAALCNIEHASALRGNSIRVNDLHRSERIAQRRKLKKGTSGKEPYEIVAEHEGGLFGTVKKVAKKAKEKQEAAVAASIASVNVTSNATMAPTAVPSNETLPRDLPVFSLQFLTTSDYDPTDDLVNYDELEEYLAEYLDDRMNEVFQDTPGDHLFTELFVDMTEDPFTVDVYATTNFKIPGQVPKDEYLVLQAMNAFTVQDDPDEYYHDFEYLIKALRSMNTTNPFHKTVDIVYKSWEKTPEKKSEDNSAYSAYWASVFSLLTITAVLSMVITILYAFKKHRDSQYIIHDDPLHLHVVKPRNGINGMPYNDEESLRHLDSVRKHYSESNNLEPIPFVPQDPQLEPSGSYEAPLYVGYKDDVEEEDSEESDEYTEQVIEDGHDEEEEEIVEEEFTDEPQEKVSNLGRFERLIGSLRGEEDESVEEEIIEDDEEESYDEQTVGSDDLLDLSSVPVQLNSASQPVDPPPQEPTTKDLFSMWENNGNKRKTAPVAGLNTIPDDPVAKPPQEPPAPKNNLFSFWAIKAGESKDDDESEEEAAVETTEQAEAESDDESTEEHTLI